MSRLSSGSSPTDPLSADPVDGRYRLEALIGRGGMGAVYRALDLRLDRPVALKVLRDAGDGDTSRFEAEVRILARFVHPNLVRLLDAGELDGRPYLVMDLVEGPTVAQRIAAGPLTAGETAKIGAGVAAALAYVHDAGIVHRDVKPANVLLDSSGTALLADFGIARLVDTTGMTATGFALGTPAYLAPEQVQGGEVGSAADVYALGLVLIESLSGKRAFEGTPSEITAARLHREPPLPGDLDADWRELLRSMTARLPAERPSAATIATTLSDTSRFGDVAASSDQTLLLGDATAVLADDAVRDTALLAPTATMLASTMTAPTIVAPVGTGPVDPPGSPYFPSALFARWRLLGLVLSLLIVALLLGLTFGGVFSGSGSPPRADTPPTTATTTSTISTTTTSPTTTTVPPTTTTDPSVASAAGSLVAALQTGVANGGITSQAAQQLTNQLQPLLFPTSAEKQPQEAQQFDQLAQQFNQLVQTGQITSTSEISALTGAIDGLATALGTTVPPTSTVPTPTPAPAPGPGPGHGHGHGHGKGNGND